MSIATFGQETTRAYSAYSIHIYHQADETKCH